MVKRKTTKKGHMKILGITEPDEEDMVTLNYELTESEKVLLKKMQQLTGLSEEELIYQGFVNGAKEMEKEDANTTNSD